MSKKTDIIFGLRAILEAIKSGKQIDKIVFRKGLQGELFNELFSMVKSLDIPFQFVPTQKINHLTKANHQGAVAFISPIEFQKIENIIPMLFEQGNNPFIFILDQVSDVRNFGAIVRSAECSGVHAIIIPQKGTARISSDSIKTSAGALYNIPICRSADIKETLTFLKNSGIQTVAATEKSEKFHFEIDFKLPTAIIMGAEEKGISKEILAQADEEAKIPLYGEIESLNVSVAASVFMYELVRQRM